MNDFAHKCKNPFLSLSLEENASLKAPWQGHSGSQSPRNWPSIILYSTTLSLSTTYKYHSNLHQMSLSSASNRTVTWCKWRANLRQVTRQSDASYKTVSYCKDYAFIALLLPYPSSLFAFLPFPLLPFMIFCVFLQAETRINAGRKDCPHTKNIKKNGFEMWNCRPAKRGKVYAVQLSVEC